MAYVPSRLAARFTAKARYELMARALGDDREVYDTIGSLVRAYYRLVIHTEGAAAGIRWKRAARATPILDAIFDRDPRWLRAKKSGTIAEALTMKGARGSVQRRVGGDTVAVGTDLRAARIQARRRPWAVATPDLASDVATFLLERTINAGNRAR